MKKKIKTYRNIKDVWSRIERKEDKGKKEKRKRKSLT